MARLQNALLKRPSFLISMKSVIDMAIRIKNGYMAKKPDVVVKCTNLSLEVLKKLLASRYIEAYEVEEVGFKKTANVKLKYESGRSVFKDLKIISKPGQKMYVVAGEIPHVLNGLGVCFLSTSKGIMTGYEAKKANIGGELLFSIW
jgi:small subunit ribosomal protein S8